MSKRGYPPEKKGPGIYIAAGVLVLLICLLIKLIRSYNYSFVHRDRRRRSRLYRRRGHTDYYENHRYDRNYDDAYDSNYDFDDSSWDH